jgi:DNA polymerase III subunit alpha
LCNLCNDKSHKVHAEPKRFDNFVNLHLHTSYSLLDGMSKPEDVIKKVASLKQKAVAVTEHGNVYSAVKVHKLAKKENIKHIYGAEFYITEDRFVKDKDKKYYHLTVLAKNEQGRLNINTLATLGFLEGFYYKPRIDHKLLKQYGEGLIVLSGCMGSEVQQALAGGKIGDGDVFITDKTIDDARGIVKWYRETFGEDYYMEVQSHRDYRQQKLNKAIVDIAEDMGIEYVATTDSHFVDEDDFELHNIFIQIGQNREAGETYEDTHIMDSNEVTKKLLGSLSRVQAERAVRTSLIVADKCNVDIPLSAPLIPHVDVPFEYADENEYLRDLCNKGWIERGINKKSKTLQSVYKDRLMFEYNAITEMGFTGYYLLVHGYANSVERRGIARGSGGGSLVAYLINIVDIDPIKYGLYFERFIDVSQLDLLKSGQIQPHELKIPDFDLDFGTLERERVVQNIEDEYTKEHFASLGQFGYIWDKSAIKDVGRVLSSKSDSIYFGKLDFNILNNITKDLNDLTIQDAREEGYIHKWEKRYPKLFEYAEKLAGLPRSFGVHPCGKVITIDKITHYHAVAENEGHLVFQMDMEDAESLGLVKIDALGLRTVDVIFDVLDLIKKRYRDYLDPAILNFDDKRVFQEVFQKGFTDGVFQFESDGMKRTLEKMKPTSLDDLGAVNALYRPGAMKYIDNYIARKHGEEEITYLHPDLESVLSVTYGIIVYQEQLIEIGRLAGMRNADLLRQATGKKDIKKMNKAKPELFEGLKKRGWNDEQLEQLWSDMLDFAKYSFNRSHSYAYAIIAYMCAYLKVYHPTEFIVALFNSFDGKPDRFEGCYQEARRLGVEVTPINFENPTVYCQLIDGKVNYGLKLVKHLNTQVAESLYALKDKKYDFFVDLLVDITENTTIDSRQMGILIELDFFKKFAHKQYIRAIYSEFKNSKFKYDKKHKDKTKEKRIPLQRENETEIMSGVRDFELLSQTTYQLLEKEKEFYGFIRTTLPEQDDNSFAIIDINTKYTPRMYLYNLKTGDIITLKVKKKKFYNDEGIEQLYVGDIINITGTTDEGKWKLDEEKGWIQDDSVKEAYLHTCKLVERNVVFK